MTKTGEAKMKDLNTTIILIPADVELFKLFRQHQEKFYTLLANGVFDLANGKAIINCDHEGKIRTIVVEQVVYKQ